ncbi:VOC family protein [Lactococcus garvieae]|uniref:VOC family protein n=1 Tax=Lactococcus garvieae TaxID=1363 RepID=UPI0028911941|nr:VOC family protein [Lactococcus garvieae]MDT2741611.1 VOC family protein [Lactococcus garvieae]
MITIEGFYFTVTDLDKSIKFYEELLGISPTYVEGNRWADFYQADKHFGLLCDTEINRCRAVGNNGVLNFYSDNIQQDYEQMKNIGAKIIDKLGDTPDSPYEYLSFTVLDPDENRIEIAWYPVTTQ